MPLTRDGGKPIMAQGSYSPPVGPKGMGHSAPGLGGTNHGNCGSQQCSPSVRPMTSMPLAIGDKK